MVALSTTVDLTPPLKWAGGKRWLVSTLCPLWLPHSERQFVEPFVGGMAVALGLQPESALLNDVNAHLINFYSWLQRGLITDLIMKNDSNIYYQHRDRFNTLIQEGLANTPEAAALFYYLNRTGYNGLCRFNRKGLFNVPFGKYKNITYTYDFSPYKFVLQPWKLINGDFSEIHLHPKAFVYADPPYDVEFTTYSAGGFSWEEQVRLAHWLAAHPGPVVASNQATERVLSLYGKLGFEIEILNAPRRIACNGDRSPAPEMLATKGV
jgi:DNA adenine methylase